MRIISLYRAILMSALFLVPMTIHAGCNISRKQGRDFTISDGGISVTVSEDGCLKSLIDKESGTDYASGGYLWRLYYDAPERKEIQITGIGQDASVSMSSDSIFISYNGLRSETGEVDFNMNLKIYIESGLVRFASEITNNEEHTVIREFQYPLVHGLQIPGDFKLITAQNGGKIYENPRKVIIETGFSDKPYKRPDQIFRQLNLKYPTGVSMNCFIFAGQEKGIYFGSHDPLFQDTWQGLRVYRDENREYTILEGGFFKYPHCFCGEVWKCDANVIAPYSGSWHEASRIYRKWADSWFDHRGAPEWVKRMPSWQRIIFKHQYGEYFFKYTDLYGRIKDVGHSVGCNAVLAFGWWEEGMDNGNPDYSPDRSQGGDEGWAEAIRKFRKDGDRLLMYFNGKLIDRQSNFYREGRGREVCYHDNTGAERTEQYRFTGEGTWLGEYDAHSFTVANTTHPVWRQKLLDMATRAFNCGANSVFYDQLGYAESQNTDWDLSREYPVPNLRVLYDKGQTLKLIRSHIQTLDPSGEFALGTEWLTDYTAQYCDYVHCYPGNSGKDAFQQFFRYTFPEIIFTDRELRDDTDVERRVNLTVLRGVRNDIEIYRCRDLIDDTPIYQSYLAKINKIKLKYADELMAGKYNDTLGFTLGESGLKASSFLSEDRMAVVITNDMKGSSAVSSNISVPGYSYVESSTAGGASVSPDGGSVSLGYNGLAVLLFKKN